MYFLDGIVSPVETVKKLNREMTANKARERILLEESYENSWAGHECYAGRGSKR
jgi:hypothetical protein